MSTNVLNVSRGDASSAAAALKANIEAQFAAALEQASLELTQVRPVSGPHEWEVFAWGPTQKPPAIAPGRIIMKGEQAYIGVGVWLNNAMLNDMYDYGAHIELNIFTSNMQTMSATNLTHTCCITLVEDQNFYCCVWEFTPTEAACLYETNICAHLCNCNNKLIPSVSGFVRHVYDFDPETLFPKPPTPKFPDVPAPGSPTPGWGFDRPIRYMVADPERECCDPDA